MGWIAEAGRRAVGAGGAAAPRIVMQPSFGGAVAESPGRSSRTPRRRSLMSHLTLAAGLWLAASAAAAQDARPAGTAIDAALREGFAAGLLEGLHCVRVELRGEAMAETCFPGEDERWGAPLGERDHGPDTLHDMRSVSKSVVGLLYGIALDEGIVPPPETPLVDAFPEYPDLAQDPERRRITVGDALSMQMGLEWDETIPYTNPRNSEIAMELAPDRYRFALERPVVGPPGEAWTYSGGATALVARIVEKGAGAPLDAYAAQRLFDPLGIADFEWVRGADGAPSAASGLRLSVRGLAAIGRMIVAGGAAPDGTQVVSAEWLERAFAPRAATMGRCATATSGGLRRTARRRSGSRPWATAGSGFRSTRGWGWWWRSRRAATTNPTTGSCRFA